MKEIKDTTTKNTTKKTNTPKTKNTEPSCRILAQGYKVMNDQIASGLNGHDLIIGSTGAGKTGGYVVPNLLITDHSMVVVDTKNSLFRSYRRYLEKKGFRVVKIDFVHPEDSATYNMLDYIHVCEKASSRNENGEITVQGRNTRNLLGGFGENSNCQPDGICYGMPAGRGKTHGLRCGTLH